MENPTSIDMLIKLLKILIENPEVDVVVPSELSDIEGFQEIYTALVDIRKAFLAIGKGELTYPVKAKGYFPGAIKSLQASLLHLTWQTKAIASGDFTQKVDFLGAFSEAFNSMTSQLATTVKELEIKEKESREAKEHFESIFNTSPDAILITRLSDGCIVDINEGFVAMSGFTREEVIGKSSAEIDIWFHPEERQKVIETVIK
jgi:PAS domain-containing protein